MRRSLSQTILCHSLCIQQRPESEARTKCNKTASMSHIRWPATVNELSLRHNIYVNVSAWPRMIFPRGSTFSCKKLTTFLVVALKTQVLNVTAIAQNTLQHSQHSQGQVPSKHGSNISRGQVPPCSCLRAPMCVGRPWSAPGVTTALAFIWQLRWCTVQGHAIS